MLSEEASGIVMDWSRNWKTPGYFEIVILILLSQLFLQWT